MPTPRLKVTKPDERVQHVDGEVLAPLLAGPEDEGCRRPRLIDPEQQHPSDQPQDLADQWPADDGGEGGADQEEPHDAVHTRTGRYDAQGERLAVVDDHEQGVARAPPIGVATWTTCRISVMANNVAVVNAFSTRSSTDVYGYGQARNRYADRQLLAPQDPDAEDDGHRAGDEEGQGQEVDPPHPEHRRQLGREEEVDAEGRGHQRHADDVVHLAVVDGRLRGPRSAVTAARIKRDDRNEADIGQRRLEVGLLEQRGERVAVGDDDDGQESTHLDGVRVRGCGVDPKEPGPVAQLRTALDCSCRGRAAMVVRHLSSPSSTRTSRERSRPCEGRWGHRRPARSALLRRCARADPPRPRGTARSCARPGAPAACCASR